MPETYHIVKDFNIGNTHIHICDDHCKNKSAADIEKILSRIASDAMTAISAASEANEIVDEIQDKSS